MKTKIVLICSVAALLSVGLPGRSQSNPSASTPSQSQVGQAAGQNHRTVHKKKNNKKPAKEMANGGKDVGIGAAKGAASLGGGVAGGAADLATGNVGGAATSVGKGAAGMGKNVGVGATKGGVKISKGLGGELKKLGKIF
ncbi:MAG: hypothetical protein ACRD11_03840 [Terriglobia bacterium]